MNRRFALLAISAATALSAGAQDFDRQSPVRPGPGTTIKNPIPPFVASDFRVISVSSADGRQAGTAEKAELENALRKRLPGAAAGYTVDQFGAAVMETSARLRWPGKITIGVKSPKGWEFTATFG
jgi:hypothetical protein